MEPQPEPGTGTIPEHNPDSSGTITEPKPEEAEQITESKAEDAMEGNDPEAEVSTITQQWLITVYCIIIVLTVGGNITVIVVIVRHPELRKNISNIYLLSLVTARTMIGIFVIPARITGLFSAEYLGSGLCKACQFAAMTSAGASILSIVTIAIVNYRIIVIEDMNTKMTTKQSFIILGVVWGLALMYAIRAIIIVDLFIFEEADGSHSWECGVLPQYKNTDKNLVIADMVVLFIIPFCIVCCAYSAVIRKLAHKRRLSEFNNINTTLDAASKKVIHMLIVLVILFCICTVSPLFVQLYILWGGTRFDKFSIFQEVIYMFSYSNAWFNIIVFAIFRADLRDGLRQLGACTCLKKHTSIVDVKPTEEHTVGEIPVIGSTYV